MTADTCDRPEVVNSLLAALRLLPRTEQIALRRFYCDGEPDEIICAELGLDVGEFRELRHQLRTIWRRTQEPSQQAHPSLRRPPATETSARTWLWRLGFRWKNRTQT